MPRSSLHSRIRRNCRKGQIGAETGKNICTKGSTSSSCIISPFVPSTYLSVLIMTQVHLTLRQEQPRECPYSSALSENGGTKALRRYESRLFLHLGPPKRLPLPTCNEPAFALLRFKIPSRDVTNHCLESDSLNTLCAMDESNNLLDAAKSVRNFYDGLGSSSISSLKGSRTPEATLNHIDHLIQVLVAYQGSACLRSQQLAS